MLAGNLSNQDEDEVEEELAALQQQAQGPVVLPEPPTITPQQPETPEAEAATGEDEKTEQGEVVRKKAQAAIPAS